jgi:hypothetical protein
VKAQRRSSQAVATRGSLHHLQLQSSVTDRPSLLESDIACWSQKQTVNQVVVVLASSIMIADVLAASTEPLCACMILVSHQQLMQASEWVPCSTGPG